MNFKLRKKENIQIKEGGNGRKDEGEYVPIKTPMNSADCFYLQTILFLFSFFSVYFFFKKASH